MRSILCLAALTLSLISPAAQAAGDAPDFNRDVRPILSDRCYHCHGPDEKTRQGGLRLDTPEGAARVLKGSRPEDTRLVRRLVSPDPDKRMPPPEANFVKPLLPQEAATLRAWVAAGARYSRHWAFEPPVAPPLPEVSDPAWRQPIDRFLLARLQRAGLRPSPEADRATLLRRVTLDLAGLPPTWQETEAFLKDPSPDAYEKVVDRLLRSPRYGERMALAWMDLARYGDSSVYHADGPRDMWGWRDWVIRAFNDNMPFDRFTTEQIAGDLLPAATAAQKVASGFNRNHATTDEGGVIPEEFRVDYVVDRVKTVANTWLALSLECGQCHDHKYDPISQREYYSFYAYFNNTRDPGMQTRNGNSGPLVEVPDPTAESRRLLARTARQEAQTALAAHRDRARSSPQFAAWLAKQTPPPAVTPPAAPLAWLLPCDERPPTSLTSLDGSPGTPSGAKLSLGGRPGGDGLKLPGNVLVEFTGGLALDPRQPFSVAWWMKLPASGGGALLTRMDPDPTYRGFDVGAEGMRPGLHLVNTWSANALKVYAKSPVTPDQWHHVVITADGSGKAAGLKIYVDGAVQENQVTADTLTGPIATDTPLRLGGRGEGGGFNGSVDDLAVWHKSLTPEEVKAAARDPLAQVLAVPAAQRTPEQTDALLGLYLRQNDKTYTALVSKLAQGSQEEKRAGKGTTTVMVMEDLPPGQTRTTYVLNRGQYDQPRKDQPVPPGVPAALGPLLPGAPPNRLGLARWLVRPDHPLTARVAVNRTWGLFFGTGLVRTSEDFGLQGEVPSHPDLLDWLAVDFVRHGWDVQRLVRQIVTSAAYRQDSRTPPAQRERDPDNRMLARGPRFRLQGEFLRDSALAVSGLLVERIGGPSVRPYQPAGVWEEVALDTGLSRYVQDRGDKLYRRSLYTYWKRSSPHPAMTTFDVPSREKCVGNRPRTNTPLQALVTLNDPQFVEAARAFAGRILKEGGSTPEERARFAVRTALGRPASDREVSLLARHAASQLARFQADPKKAASLLQVGESPRDPSLPAPEHAAWTVVASTVLNLDEFLVKN